MADKYLIKYTDYTWKGGQDSGGYYPFENTTIMDLEPDQVNDAFIRDQLNKEPYIRSRYIKQMTGIQKI